MDDAASTGELTQLLAAWNVGERDAFDRLIPLVYGELRRMAGRYLHRERADHTLQPTALVHELFSRLVQREQAALNDRRHFFAIAATTMRHAPNRLTANSASTSATCALTARREVS